MGQKHSSRESLSGSSSSSSSSSSPLPRFVRQNSCGRKPKQQQQILRSESDNLLLEDNFKTYMSEIRAYKIGTWLHELGLMPRPVKEDFYNKMMSHYALLTPEQKKAADEEHGEPPTYYMY